MNNLYIQISELINKNIFPKLNDLSINIFLIGAGEKRSDNLRDLIRGELEKWKYINRIDVYYPEDLFEELMHSRNDFDLLSLENLMARSVHAIVIVLESPGAIAELGAFANREGLNSKLVVVMDKKFKKARSFINLGLIKFLKKTDSIIIYHEFKSQKKAVKIPGYGLLDLTDYSKKYKLLEKIRKAIKDIADGIEIDKTVANPIIAQYYLLASIYVTEPVNREKLNLMVKSVIEHPGATEVSNTEIETIVMAALNILLFNKEVKLINGYYKLTNLGYERFCTVIKKGSYGNEIERLLDNYRVKVLNVVLRKKQARLRRVG